MMKITRARVWLGSRCSTDRDKRRQIASFDEQSALDCVIPPASPPEPFNLRRRYYFHFPQFPLSF